MKKKAKFHAKRTILQNELLSLKKEVRNYQRTVKSVPKKTIIKSLLSSRTNVIHPRLKMITNCRNALLDKLTITLPHFDENQIMSIASNVKKGVFGEVHVCKVKYLNIFCAKKVIRGSMLELRAEAMVLQQLSGHQSFPYFFGIVHPGALLMELISNSTNDVSPGCTLSSTFQKPHFTKKKKDWFGICRDLVNALHYMHGKHILHNDLHGKNILLRPVNNIPCIIDFGKATLAECPVIYNIQEGSKESKLYNKYHLHIAHELRSCPNTPQSFATDVYSLGYNFRNIGHYHQILGISRLAKKMLKADPLERYTLDDCLVNLLQ